MSKSFIDLSCFDLSKKLANLLPYNTAQKYHVIPLGNLDGDHNFYLGMLDSEDDLTIKKLEGQVQSEIKPVQINRYEFNFAINQIYKNAQALSSSQKTKLKLSPTHTFDYKKDENIPELVNQVVAHGIYLEASDIHIEVYENDVDLRYRVDGVLNNVASPISLGNVKEFVNRVMVLAEMDASKSKISQDGSFTVTYDDGENREFTLRVNAVPALNGVDLVIRLTEKLKKVTDIKNLGMRSKLRSDLFTMINNTEGLILVTGPTNSGKSTTVFSALSYLANENKKILTVENPVENAIPGVNHKEVSTNMDFKDYMRAFLRQDPDVMLIGEVRDRETADLAIQASSNGSLIIATLHSPELLGTFTRLWGLNCSWENLSSAILGIINQRLVRRVCPHCKTSDTKATSKLKEMGIVPIKGEFIIGEGCEACHGTGYKGRVGLYEHLMLDDELTKAVYSSKGEMSEVRRLLIKRRHESILVDGLKKAMRGYTSLDEILRVVPLRTIMREAQVLNSLIRSS